MPQATTATPPTAIKMFTKTRGRKGSARRVLHVGRRLHRALSREELVLRCKIKACVQKRPTHAVRFDASVARVTPPTPSAAPHATRRLARLTRHQLQAQLLGLGRGRGPGRMGHRIGSRRRGRRRSSTRTRPAERTWAGTSMARPRNIQANVNCQARGGPGFGPRRKRPCHRP